MQRKALLLALCATAITAGVFVSNDAAAGMTTAYSVSINTGTRTFGGDFGYIHNSTNRNEYLYCYVIANASGTNAWCGARDAAGNSVSCYTSTPSMVNAIGTVNSDAHLDVAYDTSGNCTALYIYNWSSTDPKR